MLEGIDGPLESAFVEQQLLLVFIAIGQKDVF
jgi:hypothetical protein